MTAWVEGKPDAGIGEGITFSTGFLPGATRLRIVIKNGYQKSARLLELNAAPRTIAVIVKGRDQKVSGQVQWTLDRKMGEQLIEVPLTTGVDEVTLKIEAVHPGSKWQDTCISDVQIFAVLPTGKTLDAKLQQSRLDALKEWRQQRLARAKHIKDLVRKSDFASHTFALERGDAKRCTGLTGAAALIRGGKDLLGAAEAGAVEVTWYEPKSGSDAFTPDGLGGFNASTFVTDRKMKGFKKAKRGTSVDELGDCGGCADGASVFETVIGVENNGARAFIGQRRAGFSPDEMPGNGTSVAAFEFNESGHTVLAVFADEPAADGEGSVGEEEMVELSWSKAGKIDGFTVVSFDGAFCDTSVYKAVP